MEFVPQLLEPKCEWRRDDVSDPARWTERLSAAEREELDGALRHAQATGRPLLEIGAADFPLPRMEPRLRAIEKELIDGRGFVLLRGLERERYDQAEMELLYWGIGMHLGRPWAQNAKGHLLGDVLDQGKTGAEGHSRGNELGGQHDFPYHSDGSDLVGLLCLQRAKQGGASTVANAVAIHNDLVREAPELAAALYRPQPFDFRGEQPPGGKGWYEMPVFTRHDTPQGSRLFVRYIRPYILASQRHADAPRIADDAEQAMRRVDAMTIDPEFNVVMDFEPGDMQFVNNYHVLHARRAYVDDPASGLVRHLKRLWLETDVLAERPEHFRHNASSHWDEKHTVSQLAR